MNLGFSLPQSGPWATADAPVRAARCAEAIGLPLHLYCLGPLGRFRFPPGAWFLILASVRPR